MRTIPELQFESAYIEDGVLNVLISPAELADDRRYTVEAEPDSRKILDISLCLSKDEGIFPLEFKPTEDDLAAFREIVEKCPVDAVDPS